MVVAVITVAFMVIFMTVVTLAIDVASVAIPGAIADDAVDGDVTTC